VHIQNHKKPRCEDNPHNLPDRMKNIVLHEVKTLLLTIVSVNDKGNSRLLSKGMLDCVPHRHTGNWPKYELGFSKLKEFMY
jgi:hypothetical protein